MIKELNTSAVGHDIDKSMIDGHSEVLPDPFIPAHGLSPDYS